MKISRHAILRALILTTLTFATTSATANPILNYLRDRAYDFADIFRFRVSIPEGNRSLGFHVKATSLAQLGLAHHDGQSLGMDRRVMGHWDETRSIYGVSLLTWSDVWRERATGNQFADPYTPWHAYGRRSVPRDERIHWDDGRRSPLGLGLELHTAILPGLDFGLYPLEMIDFIGGVFLIDMRRDDLSRVEAFYGAMMVDTEMEPLEISDHATTAPVFDPLGDVILEELGSQVTTGELYRRMAPESEQVDILSILERAVREAPETDAEMWLDVAPEGEADSDGAEEAQTEPAVTPDPTPAP